MTSDELQALDVAIAERRQKILDLQAEEARVDAELRPMLEQQRSGMAEARVRPPAPAPAQKLAPDAVESDFETGKT